MIFMAYGHIRTGAPGIETLFAARCGMKKIISIALLLPFLIVNAIPLIAGGEWKKIKDMNGIRVYQRSVPATDLVEYLAVTPIANKMEVIGEALRDVPFSINGSPIVKRRKS
jgi:hypothetical protein